MIGRIAGTDVHWGLRRRHRRLRLLLRPDRPHHASASPCRVTGGNLRAAQLQGLPVARLIVSACALGGACAGLAGMIEVAAVHGNANASLVAGYGYAGILVAFLARHNPLAIIPMAMLLGGIGAAGGLLQRRLGLPDATVLVLQGMIFVVDPGQRDAATAAIALVPAARRALMMDRRTRVCHRLAIAHARRRAARVARRSCSSASASA